MTGLVLPVLSAVALVLVVLVALVVAVARGAGTPGEDELRARPGADGQWSEFPVARTPDGGVEAVVPGDE